MQNVRKKVLNTFPNTVLEDLNLGILSLAQVKACRKILFTTKPNLTQKKNLYIVFGWLKSVKVTGFYQSEP